MGKYNLEKKQTFWALYKRNIIGSLVVVSIPLVLLILYHVVEVIYYIYQNIDYQNLNFALLVLASVLTLIYIIRYFIFLHRQLYIPITENELIQNGITSNQEYKEFLMGFLLGFPIRNRKLNRQSTMTSFIYLTTKAEQYDYIRELEKSHNYELTCSDDRCEKILEKITEYHKSDQKQELDSYTNLYHSIKNEGFNYFGGDFRFLLVLLVTCAYTLINQFIFICPPDAVNESNNASVVACEIIVALNPLENIIILTLLLIILKSILSRLIKFVKRRNDIKKT